MALSSAGEPGATSEQAGWSLLGAPYTVGNDPQHLATIATAAGEAGSGRDAIDAGSQDTQQFERKLDYFVVGEFLGRRRIPIVAADTQPISALHS